MPDHDEFERHLAARALSCADRSRILAAERVPLTRRFRPSHDHPEFMGLVSFERWLIDSGRVADDGGSPWWRTVNGLLLLDIADSVTRSASGDLSDPVQSWVRYRDASSRADRRAAWWAAHQHSLDAACSAADSLLAGEPAAERAFIAVSTSSVRVAATARFSTRRVGSWAISEFCSTLYPDGYPAGDRAGVDGSDLLQRWGDRPLRGLRTTGTLLSRRRRTLDR